MKYVTERVAVWGTPNEASYLTVRNCLYVGCLFVFLSISAIFGVCWSEAGPAFKDADPSLVMVFPRDHGKHPDFQTEWWYFTGNLESGETKWGFQLTFFRRSLFTERSPVGSSWVVRDIYPAHFALTDITNRRFFHAELLSREGPGLAGAADDDLKVWVRDWVAERQSQGMVIRANGKGHSLELLLRPEKDKVLHGEAGYSRKGDTPGQASHYYSFTRLKADGTLTYEGQAYPVTGQGWMDHEFGSSILLINQAGWDWFSLQLEDGTEFMIFRLRNRDGTFERPFGTFVPAEGKPIDLGGKHINIFAGGFWVSPRTQARYPSGWTIEIPDKRVVLEIDPFLDDQELVTAKSTRVIYWEGAVKVKGTREGKPVEGKGYVELTGYADTMAGRL